MELISILENGPILEILLQRTNERCNTLLFLLIRGASEFISINIFLSFRYVKIDFLTHYGEEFYCPISIVRVHGYTVEQALQERILHIYFFDF